MTDREKMLEILQGLCIKEKIGEGLTMREKFEQIADQLIANGVTVKEPQKPLTVEEVKKLPKPVYLECTYFAEMYVALPFNLRTQGIPCVGMQMADGFEYCIIDKYGKTWRCWAEKPTDAERKAAEWLK